MYHHAKFRADRSNGCRDATIQFFKMAVVRHLGFLLRVWTTHEAQLVVFIALPILVVIGIVVLKICDFQYFAH